jgi:hypothetical protein
LVQHTGNGSEFIGGHDRNGKPTGLPAAMRDSQHVRIRPAAHTYQNDVETVYRLKDNEFFDLETFSSRGLTMVDTYQLYFNLARHNSHKEDQTPWQIVERLSPRVRLELCLRILRERIWRSAMSTCFGHIIQDGVFTPGIAARLVG